MHDNEYQLLIQNKLPGISGFVQTLAGYYCQFLETDFKKSREPKRKFLNRDNLGRKVGIRTSKYSHFKNLLVDEINFKKQNSNIVIESNKYKSSLPASTEVSIITAIDTIDLDSLSNDFLPLEKNIYRQLGIPNSNIQKFISAEISPVGRDLAHEIRGPLAGIRANTEALSLSMSSDDFKIFQQNIIDNTSQMNKLVEGLTLLSEIEGQGKGLKTENFNIKKAIKNTINNQETNQRINDKNINIPIKQIDDNIFLVANQNLIEICFSNIINNAIDFSSNGKDIYIEVIEKRKYIYINIYDEGTGIPPEILKKISKGENYVSSPRPKTNRKSTGLGLNIVRRIINKHNGRFDIKNRGNKQGVVVTLTLPKQHKIVSGNKVVNGS